MKKVAIYVRVSTLEQAEHGYSISEQTDKLEQYCHLKDWKIFKVYKDGGFSGASTDRPALKELIFDAKKHSFDTVLVYKLDRLSRSQKDTLYLIEDIFTKNDIDFVSLSESFDTSNSFGKAIIGILSVFAQLEREQIRERMMSGKLGRAKAGLPMGWSNIPFGYDYKDSKYVINKLEASIVKFIFEHYIEIQSVTYVRDKLNDDGHIAKDVSWSYRTIRQILDNKLYTGKIIYQDKEYDGQHEAIISTETYTKAQKILRRNKMKSTNKSPFKIKYMLSGISRCGYCSAPLRIDIGKKRNGENTYRYSCRNRTPRRAMGNPIYNDGKQCDSGFYYREYLENIVIQSIKELQFDLEELIEKNKYEKDNDLSEEYKERIHVLANQEKKIIDLYLTNLITSEEMEARADSITKEKNQLEKMINEQEETTNPAIEYLKSFDFNIEKLSYNEKKELAHMLINRIYVTEEEIKIDWNFTV